VRRSRKPSHVLRSRRGPLGATRITESPKPRGVGISEFERHRSPKPVTRAESSGSPSRGGSQVPAGRAVRRRGHQQQAPSCLRVSVARRETRHPGRRSSRRRALPAPDFLRGRSSSASSRNETSGWTSTSQSCRLPALDVLEDPSTGSAPGSTFVPAARLLPAAPLAPLPVGGHGAPGGNSPSPRGPCLHPQSTRRTLPEPPP
jgi:hypothetical protein